MVQKLNRFWTLSIDEKGLFIEAWFLLGLMRVLIAIAPLKRITKSLKQSATELQHSLPTSTQLDRARKIGNTITKAANNTPWESACLTQALTAQKMLRRRNIPGAFYLGAKKDGSDKDKLEAHAWSQCNGLIVTGEKEYKSYKVLSTYYWE